MADLVDRREVVVHDESLAGLFRCLARCARSARLSEPVGDLASVFLIGIGFAFSAPAWSALVPEVVTNEELPSAVTLGGLQFNLCGIVGPAIAAVILTHFGANWIFAANAMCFLFVIGAIARTKRKEKQPRLPLENFFESIVGAIRYVRYAPGIQVVLAEMFFFPSSSRLSRRCYRLSDSRKC